MPGCLPPADPHGTAFDLNGSQAPATLDALANGTGIGTFVGSAAQAAAHAVDTRWVVKDMLPEGALIIIAGPAKRGRKTLTGTHLGLCVARGENFIGQPVLQRPVLYSYFEDGLARVGRRMRAFGVDPAVGTNGAPTREHPRFFYSIGGRGWREGELIRRVQQCSEPILWIIDPLIFLESLYQVEDENKATEIEKLLGPFRELTQGPQHHTIALVHHFKKSVAEKRGSSALDGSTDGWWDMHPQQGGNVRIEWTLRDGEDGAAWIRHRFENDTLVVSGGLYDNSEEGGPVPVEAPGATSKAGKTEANLAKLKVALVSAIGGNPYVWRTSEDLAQKTGLSTGTVKRTISKLSSQAPPLVYVQAGPGGGFMPTPQLIAELASTATATASAATASASFEFPLSEC